MNLQITILYISLGLYALISSDVTMLRVFAAVTLYLDVTLMWSKYQEHNKVKLLLERLKELQEKQK